MRRFYTYPYRRFLVRLAQWLEKRLGIHRKKMQPLYIAGGSLIAVNLLVIIGCNWQVEYATRNMVFQNVRDIPATKVGLLLGTSKRLSTGQPNPYFYNRIEAAVELYHAGKIQYILVSGDNGSIYYNEPRDMQRALVARGIPKNAIYQDCAGFRTLDSVVRCKEIFGQNRFTIISQDFHTRRALYIARSRGMEPLGYNARDVHHHGLKTLLREKFARVKAFMDVNLLQQQPRFLGDKIEIR